MAKKAAHGGARKGAGRKPGEDGPTMTVVVTVPESLVAKLDARSKAEGWGRSKAVTEAIRAFVARQRGR